MAKWIEHFLQSKQTGFEPSTLFSSDMSNKLTLCSSPSEVAGTCYAKKFLTARKRGGEILLPEQYNEPATATSWRAVPFWYVLDCNLVNLAQRSYQSLSLASLGFMSPSVHQWSGQSTYFFIFRHGKHLLGPREPPSPSSTPPSGRSRSRRG